MPLCPICARPVASRTQNAAFPFCSTRCKQIDLGKWLNEEYRIPVPDASTEDEHSSEGTEQPQPEKA